MNLLFYVCIIGLSQIMHGKFLYFAYGSNLLAKRIHVNNPTAVRAGIGKLENYRLDFVTISRSWKGAISTVVYTPGRTVWGAIWEIDNENLRNLDKQEGVASGVYIPLEVNIIMPDGGHKMCRVYQQSVVPKEVKSLRDLPRDRRPSGPYLMTIIMGAAESGLPEDYQRFLSTIPHNGYVGDVDMGFNLNQQLN